MQVALSPKWFKSVLFLFQLVVNKNYEVGLFLVYLALLSLWLQCIELMISDSGPDGEEEDERIQSLDTRPRNAGP